VTDSIVTGCEDPETAVQRAGALVGAAGPVAADMPFWQAKASMALAAFLHAAALLDRDMGAVKAWCSGHAAARCAECIRLGCDCGNYRHGDGEAVEALATDPRASRALLRALGEIQAPGQTTASIRLTMTQTLRRAAL